MKRLLCIMVVFILLIPLVALSASGNLQEIRDQLYSKMPLISMGYSEFSSGRIFVDLFLEPTSVLENNIPAYILYSHAIFSPHIKDKKVAFYTINMMDGWGKVVFEYSSKGATYGSLVDKRSGKKIKTKFSSTLDLMAYFSAYLPEKTNQISGDQLTLLNEALQYFADNPGDNAKKAAKALAKARGIKEKELLSEINNAFEALYALDLNPPQKSTLIQDYQSGLNP